VFSLLGFGDRNYGGIMEKLARIFIALGFLILVIAAISRFMIGRPFVLLGIKTLSMIVISNTLFLLAIVIKIFEKK
jgi:hypothetical protein